METGILYWVLDAIIIFIACFCVDLLFRYYDARKDRRRKACLCDICHRPRKTKQTYDKQLWVCRKCNELYVKEFKKEAI